MSVPEVEGPQPTSAVHRRTESLRSGGRSSHEGPLRVASQLGMQAYGVEVDEDDSLDFHGDSAEESGDDWSQHDRSSLRRRAVQAAKLHHQQQQQHAYRTSQLGKGVDARNPPATSSEQDGPRRSETENGTSSTRASRETNRWATLVRAGTVEADV